MEHWERLLWRETFEGLVLVLPAGLAL